MTSAFVSYSHHDRVVADFVADHLRNRGVDVFIDYRRLKSGNFVEQLGVKIEQQKYFLVVISPNAVEESKWVKAEVTWAFSQKDTEHIIPIWYKPAKLTKVFVLAGLERVDFTRWDTDRLMDDDIEKLCRLMSIQNDKQVGESVPKPTLNGNPLSDSAVETEKPLDNDGFPQFAKSDVAKIFQSAVSAQSEDPEKALFLYERVLELDPDFMKGGIENFVKRQEENMMPMRLYQLETRIKDALSNGLWAEVKPLAETILDIHPYDPDASDYIVLAEQNIECEPIYQQAKIAFDNGNQSVVNLLMEDISSSCPNYGDPAELLKDQPIAPGLIGFLRNTQILIGHTGSVRRVILSPRGSMLATISSDETVRLWAVSSGTLIKEFRQPARALAFSPDETYLAVATYFSSVALIRVHEWDNTNAFIEETSSNCNDLVFSNDGKTLITGWEDGCLKVHDVPEIMDIRKTISGIISVESLSLQKNGLIFVNFGSDNSYPRFVRVWRVDSWDKVKVPAFDSTNEDIIRKKIMTSLDERFLACYEDNRIVIRHLPQGWEDWKYFEPGIMPVANDFSLSPVDSSLVVMVGVNSDRSRMLFYDRVTDKCLGALVAHQDAINAVAVSLDGRFIATGSDDCSAKIWQL